MVRQAHHERLNLMAVSGSLGTSENRKSPFVKGGGHIFSPARAPKIYYELFPSFALQRMTRQVFTQVPNRARYLMRSGDGLVEGVDDVIAVFLR